MREIKEILYMATLRCNYDCKHCGEKHLYKENEEMSSLNILNMLKSSQCAKNCEVVLTGGEPFLKKDIESFILGIVNDGNLHSHLSITTNGYYVDKIQSVVSKVNDISKLTFSVSVDGFEKAHNAIRGNELAYKRAIKSIEVISSYGVHVEVNTVMQKDNFADLSAMRQLFFQFSPNVKYTPVPLTLAVSKEKEFPYKDEELSILYPYIRSHNDLKYLVSKGNFNITDCHAGSSNIVIDPRGKVYSCSMACAYLNENQKDNYCIGDLKNESIDEIMHGNRRVHVINSAVKQCSGCNANCDVQREESYYGLKFSFLKSEIKYIFNYVKPCPQCVYDFSFDNEEQDGNLFYHWMNSKRSMVYLPNPEKIPKDMVITYRNVLPSDYHDPLKLQITVNGISQDVPCSTGIHKIRIPILELDNENDFIKVVFEVNHMWSPSAVFGGDDQRELGIALISAQLQDYRPPYKRLDTSNLNIKLAGCVPLAISKMSKTYPVQIFNDSQQILFSDEENPVHLSYHILGKEGSMILFDGIRTDISPAIYPGEGRFISINLDLSKPNIKVGDIFRITMVQEGQFWFDDINSGIKLDLSIIE